MSALAPPVETNSVWQICTNFLRAQSIHLRTNSESGSSNINVWLHSSWSPILGAPANTRTFPIAYPLIFLPFRALSRPLAASSSTWLTDVNFLHQKHALILRYKIYPLQSQQALPIVASHTLEVVRLWSWLDYNNNFKVMLFACKFCTKLPTRNSFQLLLALHSRLQLTELN